MEADAFADEGIEAEMYGEAKVGPVAPGAPQLSAPEKGQGHEGVVTDGPGTQASDGDAAAGPANGGGSDSDEDDEDYVPPDAPPATRGGRPRSAPKGVTERVRDRASRWAWLVWRARQYGGRLCSPSDRKGLCSAKELRRIMTDVTATRKQRRERVVAACVRRADKHAAQLDFAVLKSGDELVDKMLSLIHI